MLIETHEKDNILLHIRPQGALRYKPPAPTAAIEQPYRSLPLHYQWA